MRPGDTVRTLVAKYGVPAGTEGVIRTVRLEDSTGRGFISTSEGCKVGAIEHKAGVGVLLPDKGRIPFGYGLDEVEPV